MTADKKPLPAPWTTYAKTHPVGTGKYEVTGADKKEATVASYNHVTHLFNTSVEVVYWRPVQPKQKEAAKVEEK